MQPESPRPVLGPLLVETRCGSETIAGYLAGWVAKVDGAAVGFVRSSPRQARRDLLAFALATTPGGVVHGGNAAGTFA